MQSPLIELSPERHITDDSDQDTASKREESQKQIVESCDLRSERNSIQETLTPALFESAQATPKKFAPFGTKQECVSINDLKKQQKRSLPKWDRVVRKRDTSHDKITTTLKPSNSKSTIGKYANIESKVKQQLKQPAAKRSQSPKIVVPKPRMGELNLSNMYTFQKYVTMIVTVPLLVNHLIELDFSAMINQINEKKDILLDKIKAISHQPQRCGQIVKNGQRKAQRVDLIDLYSNMIQQRRENKENAKPVCIDQPISPKKDRKREPGKITRQSSCKKQNDPHDEKRRLEEEYQSAVNQAKEIQMKLQTIDFVSI